DKGMALIAEIPLVDMRIEALGAAARQAAAKDPSTGKAALTKCVQMLDEAKTAPVEVWLDVAEAAHHLKDEERAKSAFDRALSVALERYKDDTNGENPNLALREFWPSTQSTRRIVNRAVRLYGLDAEYILPRITDPDLNTIATVEMARSLVKKPARAGSTSVNRPAKKK
ncbi:MAG TPA: hypothetical protein VEQ63_13360, partial [Bryobacteraceae bacterium]|nr:hypothetical protein [Bryobacteraceae bacterium]